MLPNLVQGPLGSDNGAGFGWEDVATFKGGLELKAAGDWAWRAGYSWGDQPIPEGEVLFNILAPGVQKQHVTFGFSKALGTRELSFAVMRSFTNNLVGANPLDPPAGQTLDLEMNQWEFELGWSFGIGR